MPGRPAEPRQRPVVLLAAPAAPSHASALTDTQHQITAGLFHLGPALTGLLSALTGSSGSLRNVLHGLAGPELLLLWPVGGRDSR